jgi:hypothetical protein
MKKKTLFIYAGAVAIFFALLFLVIPLWWLQHRGGLFPPHDYARAYPDPKEFRELVGSRLGGIELPEGATDLHLVHDGGRDPTHWISVRVAPADLESLKRQISEQAPLLDHVPTPLPRRAPEFIQSWWNPPATNLSVYGNVENQSGSFWIIDNTRAVIYCCRHSS